MEIYFHKRLPSTHTFLIDALKSGIYRAPVAVVAKQQDAGVGSRGNRWIGGEGNLFLSFALDRASLPEDLPIASTSIYYAWLMREVLGELGSQIWLKWPNDLYIGDKKAGGMITRLLGRETFVCSMGLNLKTAPESFGKVDIEIDGKALLEAYFSKLEEGQSWKDVFIKYRVEFEKSKSFSTHESGTRERLSLAYAELLEDGSVQIEERRVYSRR